MNEILCEVCKKHFNVSKIQRHHLFSQSKLNRRLYGKLIDDPKNIKFLCDDCHLNKPIPKFTEIQFCDALGIVPRSKTGRAIYDRLMASEFMLYEDITIEDLS